MQSIEVKILNPEAIKEAERMMVAMGRLTQRGSDIKCMDDLENLLDHPYMPATAKHMCRMPHPTIQKFGLINIAIVGASRRFLAQITRHQNVKFMSASLQYSDYSDKAQFVVPYELTVKDAEHQDYAQYSENYYTSNYLNSAKMALNDYEKSIEAGIDRDSAGYMMPQGLRNTLIISGSPFEIKHLINQRTCKRNTPETRYVMLRVWEELYPLSVMFEQCGPDCTTDRCRERGMTCGTPEVHSNPTDILNSDFMYIRGKKVHE